MSVLTIFLPTFNRAEILDGNLSLLCAEISNQELPITVIVSDNASSDHTESVVKEYTSRYSFVKYKKNAENLGMDGNFLSCFEKAEGKYTLLLGDDDYPIPGRIAYLVDILRDTEANLVHLQIGAVDQEAPIEYGSDEAVKEISFWITYISSNVVKSSLARSYAGGKFKGSLLAIVPLYISAIYADHRSTLLVKRRIFSDGVSSKTNGGYSYFKVFVENYSRIVREALPEQSARRLLPHLMKDIFKRYLVDGIARLLIEKDRGNYDTRDSWKILFKHYGSKPYAYVHLIKHLLVKYV